MALATSIFSAAPAAETSRDAAAVATLDIEYQAAVERNDAEAMERILADDFELRTGSGRSVRKDDLLAEARATTYVYEVQRAEQRSVRVWGDVAVVTALLHAKGVKGDRPFDSRLWYSDIYVRFPDGWRYVFGQASLALPAAPSR